MARASGERRGGLVGATRVLLVGLVAALASLAGVFALPPLDRDEARFAQASAQMLETGDYLVIRFQDAERNKKPAGAYWAQAASVSLLSDVEAREIWAYRIPSVIAGILAALFCYAAGARLYGSETGALAGLLLAAAPAFAAETTIAKTDAMLLASVTAAGAALAHLYADWTEKGRAGRGWAVCFWIAVGAGVMIKGPITPMIAGTAAAALIVRTPDFWRVLRPTIGVLVLAAMIGPWAFAIGEATDGRFFAEALGRDMWGKVGAAQERHGGPPGYHLVLLWVMFWPAAAMLAPGLIAALRTRSDWRSWLLLGWIAPAWIVFELIATKLPHYALPLYPALAILAAKAAIDGAPRALLRIGAGVYLAIGLAVGVAIAVLPAFFASAGTGPVPIGAGAIVGIGAAATAALFWRENARAGAMAAAGFGVLVAVVLLQVVLPRLDRLALSPALSAAIDESGLHPLRGDAPPVVLAGYYEPSAVFLLGTRTQLVGGAAAARWLVDMPGAAAAVEEKTESEFLETAQAAALAVEPLAEVEGLNYSNGRALRLIIYAARSTP